MHKLQTVGIGPGRLVRPTTFEDALRYKSQHLEARPIAGGTDLLLDIHRSGSTDAPVLLDMASIADLPDIELGEVVRIGARTTHADVLESSELLTAALPLIAACAEIGSPQLRNRATVVGNVATASPANDTISALMALDAVVEIGRFSQGSVYWRELALSQFITGFRQTDLEPDELIAAIKFRPLSANRRGVWAKIGNRRAQAISVVHLSVVVEFDRDEVVTDVRLAVGSAAATVSVLGPIAQILVGQPLSESLIEAAGDAAGKALSPIDDIRASAAYRRNAIRHMTSRCLATLADGADPPVAPDRLTLRRASNRPPRPSKSELTDDDEIVVSINGTRTVGVGSVSRSLLNWLRDIAGLTGTKEGCAEGECGACTVTVDDAAVMSCLVPAAQVEGTSIVTIEGLADGRLHRLQQAFLDEFAVQCGFCIPGFLMSGATILNITEHPSAADARTGLSGNLCRCTGYYSIERAIAAVAGEQ